MELKYRGLIMPNVFLIVINASILIIVKLVVQIIN
jgi:hypothetical protein